MSISLVHPNKSHEDEYKAMIKEFMETDGSVVPGSMGQKDTETFEEFLTRQENSSKGVNISPKRVPATLYFLIETDTQRLLGGIHIRHHLNDELKIISGHIGYGIRPSERKKGYATLALTLALPKARELGIKEVMLTCSKTNIGSAKTIQNNGGILHSEYIYEGDLVQQWWIT